MTLTLLALLLAPFYLKMVLDPKAGHQFIKDLAYTPSTQIVFSFILLLTSLSIFSKTGLYLAFEWESLLNWVALLIAVKGIAVLMPGFYADKLKFLTQARIPFFGFMGLIGVLLMVYVDTQILA